MTNTDKADLARKIHIMAMIALIDWHLNDGAGFVDTYAKQLVCKMVAADIAQLKITPQADRLTIYGIAAQTTAISDVQLLRAWQTAARRFLDSH